MDIVIRKLEKDFLTRNIDRFVEILSDVPGEYWGSENFLMDLTGKFRYSCYALADNILAGYIIASERDDVTVHIHKFMVAEQFRGKLIGNQLLVFFEKSLKEKKMTGVTLKVRSDNQDAIRFYENHGFMIVSKQTGTYDDYELLIMSKSI